MTIAPTNLKDKALRSLSFLPPFSPVLNRLISSLASDDVPFTHLAALIEKDTILAGNVLRVVNSALYGRQGTINSVIHAIAILGLDKLRNVALGFSVNRLWQSVRTPKSFSMSRFNLHSVATGVLADKLAQCIPIAYPEGAFAAGLFHDVGKLLIAIAAGDNYDRYGLALACTGAAGVEWERQVLGCDHAELSAAALKMWNLPEQIQTAVAYHHNPDRSRTPADAPFERTLAHLIQAADQTANELSISIALPVAGGKTAEAHPAFETLGLAEQSPELLREFDAEFSLLRGLN